MKSLRSLLHSIYEAWSTEEEWNPFLFENIITKPTKILNTNDKFVMSPLGDILLSRKLYPVHDKIVLENHDHFGFDSEASMENHTQNTETNVNDQPRKLPNGRFVNKASIAWALKKGYVRGQVQGGKHYYLEANNVSHGQIAVEHLRKLAESGVISTPDYIQIDTEHTKPNDGKISSDALDHPEEIERYIRNGPKTIKYAEAIPLAATWADKNAWRLSTRDPRGDMYNPAESYNQLLPLIQEDWQEYDVKVGETNTSLFEPGTNFDMKKFLRKLRKKHGLQEFLPGEK